MAEAHRRRRGAAVPEDRDAEGDLRGLVGGGSSKVGLSTALRIRDAARPDADELAAAERRLVVVRRSWGLPKP